MQAPRIVELTEKKTLKGETEDLEESDINFDDTAIFPNKLYK